MFPLPTTRSNLIRFSRGFALSSWSDFFINLAFKSSNIRHRSAFSTSWQQLMPIHGRKMGEKVESKSCSTKLASGKPAKYPLIYIKYNLHIYIFLYEVNSRYIFGPWQLWGALRVEIKIKQLNGKCSIVYQGNKLSVYMYIYI